MVNVDGAPVTLSVSGGVLIGGLILGWLRQATQRLPVRHNRHNGL
ncbi:hypothetical protein O9992_25515 [Vibrio lentus]|nr:hypothetical protein [Vibrio lentus]